MYPPLAYRVLATAPPGAEHCPSFFKDPSVPAVIDVIDPLLPSSAIHKTRFGESHVIQLGCPPIVIVLFAVNVYAPPLVGVKVNDWTVPW
jgi:hypothetical protein